MHSATVQIKTKTESKSYDNQIVEEIRCRVVNELLNLILWLNGPLNLRRCNSFTIQSSPMEPYTN